MKTVKCPICGREFTTNRPNKKFCGYSCKEAGEKLWRMKWNDNNPEYQSYTKGNTGRRSAWKIAGTNSPPAHTVAFKFAPYWRVFNSFLRNT